MNKARPRAFLIVTAMSVWFAAGCASVDPRPDYQRTAAIVSDQTGYKEIYQPDMADPAVRDAVAALLKEGLTVDRAVRVALLNNPRLQSLLHDVGLSRAEVVQAGLLTNPTLGIVARIPNPNEGKVNVTFNLAQSVVELLLIPIRKQIAESQLQQVQLAAAHEAVDLIAQIKKTSYQIIALERSEKITRENLELAERSLGVARRRFEAGETDKLDVNLAQAESLEVSRELLTIQRDRRMARAELGGLLGLSRWPEPWTLADELPGPRPIAGVESLMKLAADRRLDVRISQLKIDEAAEELDREKLGVISSLSLGFEHERAEAPPNLTGPSVEISLPIWHQNQAMIAKAQMAIHQREREKEATLDAAAQQVQQSAAAAGANGDLVAFFNQQAIPLGKENVEAALRSYQAGQRDILTLIQTQKSLIQLRQSYVAALKDYAAAMADLEQAVGGRLDVAP